MTDAYAADQPFYDAWNEREDDLEFWSTVAGAYEGPVLEIGVGTGRVAIPLAVEGRNVTGIDISASMLAAATARAEAAGVTVPLFDLDASEANRCPGGPFDLVIVPNDAFLHATDPDDQQAWLNAFRRAMADDGVLVIDLPGPALWLDATTNGEPLLVYHGALPDGSMLDVWQVHEDDLGSQERALTIIYDRTAPDGTLSRMHGDHALRYVYPREMALLLERGGFTPEAQFGDYSFGPLDSESERMIVLARRVTP